MKKQYTITEISKLLDIPKDTLRYYDRIGIVSPLRGQNAYRRYSGEDMIDLMHIQIMQYAGFTLEEMKGKFQFHRMEGVDPAYCRELAEFLDVKQAETSRKIAHLQKITQLLNVAADTLRNFSHESDQRLAALSREIYSDLHQQETEITKEECNGHHK